MKKIAFILSGCGGMDGSEIHETMYSFLAAKQLGFEYECFAEDKNQIFVKNHLNGKIVEEYRNILVESSRLTKNEVKNINDLDADEFDVLFFPGGIGSVINISTYYLDNTGYIVSEKVQEIIMKFYKKSKAICAICIAPMILVKILKNIKLTIGNDKKIAKIIEDNSNFHIETTSGNICIDEKNKIFSSPCFMLTKNILDIYNEVYKILSEVKKIII